MTFQSAIGSIIGLVNYAIPTLMAVALALFLWGVLRFAYKASDARAKDEDKKSILWGLVALFVLVSLWGLVGVMCQTFFDNSSCRPASIQVGGYDWSVTP